ncbi:MAG: hypothetical protein KDD40_02485 [Bdellovibrionales bacterium]|nr:hypothetical protein [Bdellovibrionales bacterium]
MTDIKELSKNNYDFAIVGSNLHALILAYTLSRNYHKKVAILEPQDFIGGNDAPVTIGEKKIMSHFTMVNSTAETIETLNWLAQILDQELFNEPLEITPLCIDSGKLIPFVGFGDRKFSTIEVLKSYTQNLNLNLNQWPSQWLEQLSSLFIGDVYTLAEITSIEIENDKIKQTIVNGSRELFADNIVFCLPPKQLKKVVGLELASHKSMQKILKNKSFTRIRMHLVTDKGFEVEQWPFHILYGSKEDNEPVVGQFLTVNEELHSLWSCWTLTELIDDHEHLGNLIKHIKKQIKRAYPEFFDHVTMEKIVVEVDSEGVGKQTDFLSETFAKIPGLWLCHPQLIENTGVIGKIQAAKLSCEALKSQLSLTHQEYVIAENSPPPL